MSDDGFTNKFKVTVHSWVTAGVAHVGHFVDADFRVTFSEQRFEVTYLHDSEYRFTVSFYVLDGEGTYYSASPGETMKQTGGMVENEEIGGEMTAWMWRVKENLEVLPQIRWIRELRERQDIVEKTVNEFPDTYATKAQFEVLREFLRNVEDRVAAVERSAVTKEEADQREAKVRAEFAIMMEQAESMTVRSSIRMVISRILKYASDPKAAGEISAVIESAKALGAGIGLG